MHSQKPQYDICLDGVLRELKHSKCCADSIAADAVTLMALSESEEASEIAKTRFGFAFLDAAAARFYVGSVTDDAGRANLGAVHTQVRPLVCTPSGVKCYMFSTT